MDSSSLTGDNSGVSPSNDPIEDNFQKDSDSEAKSETQKNDEDQREESKTANVEESGADDKETEAATKVDHKPESDDRSIQNDNVKSEDLKTQETAEEIKEQSTNVEPGDDDPGKVEQNMKENEASTGSIPQKSSPSDQFMMSMDVLSDHSEKELVDQKEEDDKKDDEGKVEKEEDDDDDPQEHEEDKDKEESNEEVNEPQDQTNELKVSESLAKEDTKTSENLSENKINDGIDITDNAESNVFLDEMNDGSEFFAEDSPDSSKGTGIDTKEVNTEADDEDINSPVECMDPRQEIAKMELLFEEAKNEKRSRDTIKGKKEENAGTNPASPKTTDSEGEYEVEDDGRIYALRKGLHTQRCIYFCWKDICEQIEDCPNAEYEVYDHIELAVAYILDNDDEVPISALKRTRSSTESLRSPKRASKRTKISHASKSKKSEESSESSEESDEGDDHVPVYLKSDAKTKKKKIVKSKTKVKAKHKLTKEEVEANVETKKQQKKKRIQEEKSKKKQKLKEDTAAAKEKKAYDRLMKLKSETAKLQKEADWEIMFATLKKYKEEIGNTNVPYSKTSKLGTWVHKQKLEYKKLSGGSKSRLTQEKVTMLKSLNFQFHDRSKYLSWDDHLESYKEFKEKHGSDFQPFSDTPLGKWVYTVRQNYKKVQSGETIKSLTPQRIEKLENIGFEWKRPQKSKSILVKEKKAKEKPPKVNVKENKWHRKYQELIEYKKENKTVVVPLNYGPLGRWVANQRKYYRAAKNGEKQKYLNEKRMKLLDDIDFEADVKRGRKSPKGLSECSEEKKKVEGLDWKASYEELKVFHKKHGHCNVPFRPTSKLRAWVVAQRREYSKLRKGADSFMTATRIQKLNDLGFNFATKPVLTWDERFLKLIEFKKKFGHVQVPRQYEGLGKWVSEQRLKYRYLQEGKPTNLSKDQIAKLNDLGMVWQVIKQPPAHQRADKKPWSVRFQELVDFKESHGHTIVPQQYPELGSWVQVQRNHYKLMKQGRKSLMTMEKALKLADIGFVFEVKPRKKKVVRQSLANPYPNLPPVDTNLLTNLNNLEQLPPITQTLSPSETMPMGI